MSKRSLEKRLAAGMLAAGLAVGLTACGDGGATTTGETSSVPATTPRTSTSASGVGIDGTAWLKLKRLARANYAAKFISAHPHDCPPGLTGRALSNYVTGQYEGTGGRPLSTPAAEVLKAMCLNSFPSG